MIRRPTWNDFLGKNSANPRDAMEALARMLFREKYGIGDALGYFKNHPGNETDTINVDGEIIGFQSKFFDSNRIGNSEANKIIDSMQEARENNPDQTTYIIYTNSAFGNPSNCKKENASDLRKTQTNSQKKIIEKAAELNFKLEWMFGENILDVVAKNELAYNVFFNNKSDLNLLHKKIGDVNRVYFKSIKSSIIIEGKDVTVSNDEQLSKLHSLVSQKKNVIISGEGGSGKSALIKSFYEEIKEKSPFIIIDAGQFAHNTIDNIVPVGSAFSVSDFLMLYADDELKLFVIDSAEKLLDIDNKTVLFQLLDIFQNDGWIFIFSIRENFLGELNDVIIKISELQFSNIFIPLLSDKELNTLMSDNNIFIPINKNLNNRIHNLFYLARYVELSLQSSISLSEYRERIWKLKMKGYGLVSREMQEARENCLIEMANRLLTTGDYIISKQGIDTKAVASLIEDEIVCSVGPLGYVFTHDIYSDWCLNYVVKIRWHLKKDIESFLRGFVENRMLLNAFRRWLDECIDAHLDFVNDIVSYMFNNKLPKELVDAILTSILCSDDYAKHYFTEYQHQLIENGFCWLTRTINVLHIYCKIVKPFVDNYVQRYPIMQPIGSGWEAAVFFVYNHRDDYRKIDNNLIVDLLKDYSDYNNKDLDVFHKAGLLALSPHIDLAEILKTGAFSYIDKASESCKLVAKYSSALIQELSNIIDEVIDNNWNSHHDPFYDLITYIVNAKDINGNLPLYKTIPDKILRLMMFCWLKNDKSADENEDTVDLDGLSVWELSPNLRYEYNYFPPSSYQTCIFPMFWGYPDKTLDFIIEFMNKSVWMYSKNEECYNVELLVNDGSKRVFIGNQIVWNLYRGTSGQSTPYLLQSIHMALETYLLQVAGKGHFDIVKKMIYAIFDKSQSLSLIAIVASIITAYPHELFDESLIICCNIRILLFDLGRYSSETHASLLEFASYGHTEMLTERKRANALKHRTQHLENVLLNMQIMFANSNKEEEKEKCKKIYRIIDCLKEQYCLLTTTDQEIARFIIARIDYRSMKKEVVDVNGVQGVKLTPVISEEQKSDSMQASIVASNILQRSSIKMWAVHRLKKQFDKIKNCEYERNPLEALNVAREILDSFGNEPQSMLPGDEFIPSLVCSTLLLDFATYLNEEQSKECVEIVISSLSNMDLMRSSGMSSLVIALNALAKLITQCPTDIKTYKEIFLAYVDDRFTLGNSRSCDIVACAIVDYKLWQTSSSFMKDVLQDFIHKHTNSGDIQELSEKDAETVLCLMPMYIESDAFYNEIAYVCLEKVAEIWNGNTKQYHNYIGCHGYTANLIARFIFSMPDDKIIDVVGFFGRYLHTSYYDSFLVPFILHAIIDGKYDKFWKIWNAFYPYVIKKNCHNNQLLNNFMLCPTGTNFDDKWFVFTEADMNFYDRIAHDIGENPNVIKNIAYNCCHIAKDWYINSIPIFDYIAVTYPTINLGDVRQNVIIYIESILKRFIDENGSKLKEDKKLRGMIEHILSFMIRNGSSYAGEVLKYFN